MLEENSHINILCCKINLKRYLDSCDVPCQDSHATLGPGAKFDTDKGCAMEWPIVVPAPVVTEHAAVFRIS